MTKKINLKGDAKARAELALMGKTVACSNEEVQGMTEIILSACGMSEQFSDLDILKDRIQKYSKENEVTHIVTNTILGGMRCITYCIDTHMEDEPKPFETDWGTGYPCSFCYVFNMDGDSMCSEFGDVFFEKLSDGFYHRAG